MSSAALRRILRIGLPVALLWAYMISCSTLRVPATAPLFQDKEFHSAARDGLVIRVRPIVNIEEYWQLFDDYLPKIGIVALWVEVRNLRDNSIAIDPATWQLRVENRTQSVLGIAALFERYYVAHGIRMYGIQTDRTARLDLREVALSPARLSASDTREGFLFFQIDPGIAELWSRAAVLVAHVIEPSGGVHVTLEIALSHATP